MTITPPTDPPGTDLPAEVPHGYVVGRFLAWVSDSTDEGDAPEWKGVKGASVTFTPSQAMRRNDSAPLGGCILWIGTQANPDFGHVTANWLYDPGGARNSVSHRVVLWCDAGQTVRTAIARDETNGLSLTRKGGEFSVFRVG